MHDHWLFLVDLYSAFVDLGGGGAGEEGDGSGCDNRGAGQG